MENSSLSIESTSMLDGNMSTVLDSVSPTPIQKAGSEGEASLSGSELASVIIYCTIGSLGVIGNTLVCIIFKLLKQRRSQVNLYILNQAAADLASAILLITFGTTRVYRSHIPIEGSTGVFLCRFWWSRFFLFSAFVISAHNLTLMSIERYVAVVHPLSYGRIFTGRFTKLTILLVWLVAPIMQYIFPIFQYAVEDGQCRIQSTWSSAAGTAAGVVLFLWEYFFPCIIMSYAYITIILTLKKKEKALMAAAAQNPNRTISTTRPTARSKAAYARRRNVTITVMAAFIVYVLCWTPNQFTFLQFNLGGPINFDGAWYLFTVVAAFLNSCSNPVVYAAMHKQFRDVLKSLIRCQTKRNAIENSSGNSTTAALATVVD